MIPICGTITAITLKQHMNLLCMPPTFCSCTEKAEKMTERLAVMHLGGQQNKTPLPFAYLSA